MGAPSAHPCSALDVSIQFFSREMGQGLAVPPHLLLSWLKPDSPACLPHVTRSPLTVFQGWENGVVCISVLWLP